MFRAYPDVMWRPAMPRSLDDRSDMLGGFHGVFQYGSALSSTAATGKAGANDSWAICGRHTAICAPLFFRLNFISYSPS